MRGRLAVGVLGLLVVAGAGAPRATAAGSPEWDGSQWESLTSGSQLTDDASTIAGHFQFAQSGRYTMDAHLSFTATDVPTGCAAPGPQDFEVPWDQQPQSSTPSTTTPTSVSSVDFAPSVTFACNGTYEIDASGVASYPWGALASSSSLPTLTDIQVLHVAPPPQGVTAKVGGDRSVAVSWSAPAGYDTGAPLDFVGYEVRRGTKSATVSLGRTKPDTRTFTDAAVPADGGTFTYSVVALRRGATATSAPTTSSAASASPASVAAIPTTTTTTTKGSSTSSGGTAGGGSTGEGSPVVSSDSGDIGTASVSGTATGTGGGRSGSAGGTATIEPDEGFESSLPYQAGGAIAARLPTDGLRTEGKGAGVLVPFAVATTLAAWAGLILFVTRSARKADEALALLPIEVVGDPLPGFDPFAQQD